MANCHPISKGSLLFIDVFGMRYMAVFVLAIGETIPVDFPFVAHLAFAVEIGSRRLGL